MIQQRKYEMCMNSLWNVMMFTLSFAWCRSVGYGSSLQMLEYKYMYLQDLWEFMWEFLQCCALVGSKYLTIQTDCTFKF